MNTKDNKRRKDDQFGHHVNQLVKKWTRDLRCRFRDQKFPSWILRFDMSVEDITQF